MDHGSYIKVVTAPHASFCVGFFCVFLSAWIFSYTTPVLAEIKIIENNAYDFSVSPYLRLDVVTLKNNLSLNSKNKDDSTTYLGLDYSAEFNLKFKDKGPEFYLKLERYGPYNYDAPVAIHNTLMTSAARIERYRGNELLPRTEEFYTDIPLSFLNLRLRDGLYTYMVGNGVSLGGNYGNYGLTLYNDSEEIKWRFYYCRPDIANKGRFGPHVKQDKEQGIAYEHSLADFFATDITFVSQAYTIQPYVGFLVDRTNAKRSNLFLTPTHKDLLGTFGSAFDATLGKFSLGLELARNFGKAKSSDAEFKDVEHVGYLIYAAIAYDLDKLKPHSRFVLGSGNKVTTEMVDNDDDQLSSGKNRAFSVYSPMNTNLADSLYQNLDTVPLVALGNGNGLNYGINRPGTFGDPICLDNIILANLGFDYQFNDKLSCCLDWWYLRSKERGVGKFDSVAKKLSPDLGNEIDVSFNYVLNENLSLDLLSGCFFPGNYYREEREDEEGSLFTPFVRGDGEVNLAYQIELSLTLSF